MSSPEPHDAAAWWNPSPLQANAARLYALGPLSVWLARRPEQLWVASRSTGTTADEGMGSVSAGPVEPPEGFVLQRFAVDETANPRLVPRHADRPVVARPEVPIALAPGQTLTAYSSAPVWVSVEMGCVLTEIPVLRPSDTWFGTTTDGTLCYAVKTHLRTDLEGVLVRAHRAITPVELHNKGDDLLRIDRIRLPAPTLAIYADDDGYLWSSGVRMTRTEGQENARVEVMDGPPAASPDAWLVSEPRLARDHENPVVRVFNSVFA